MRSWFLDFQAQVSLPPLLMRNPVAFCFLICGMGILMTTQSIQKNKCQTPAPCKAHSKFSGRWHSGCFEFVLLGVLGRNKSRGRFPVASKVRDKSRSRPRF